MVDTVFRDGYLLDGAAVNVYEQESAKILRSRLNDG